MNERPITVRLLAVLAWFIGLWSICIGAFALGAFSTGSLGNVFGVVESDGVGLTGLYNLIWGVFSFLVGFGLWWTIPWARLAALIIQAVNLVYALVSLITPGTVNWLSAVLSLVIIIYLLTPRVKQAFSGG